MGEARYKRIATKWEATNPIRGRSVDTRPIDKRRRDWETVVRIERDGVTSYGAKLYDTVCVEYFPDGAVIVRCGAWSTPSTADFITRFSPFRCWKQHNKLWIKVQDKVVPVTPTGVKTLEEMHGNEYYLAEPVVIQKSVVDRAKAKDARAPLVPFLNFAQSFLSMSDGWVMHETCKHFLGWTGESADQYRYAIHYMNERDLFNKLCDNPTEETFMVALCCFAQVPSIKLTHDSRDRRFAERFEYEMNYGAQKWRHKNDFHDVHLHFGRLKQRIYGWVHNFSDVHKVVEVKPTDKAMCKVR